ncbi:MAG: tRNA dihydrouridine synthase DusB [Methylocystis sp.]|uniref:tRNA dihydrouridine synthase DusB n=1 Tax=Methylocystis sp. TaxID=1911079 RepID=UPI003D11D13B
MAAAENLGGFELPPLNIGGIKLTGRALLAPMAGVTDPTMRRIASRFGASATISEMVTAAGVARGDRETALRLARAGEGPRIIQIAAREPDEMAAAARCAEAAGADWIDINMGCPCKRVTGGLAGAALMRDLDHAARLISAARDAICVPLSVKMRLGWDDSSRNAAELARRAEAEGAKMITVHGRTRQQFYSGRADWRAIADVKAAVRVPVIANGDCAGEEDAVEMLAHSGADGVMIGRAALGRPWIVGDIAHFIQSGGRRAAPTAAQRAEIAREHLEGLVRSMGAAAGLRHARKHLAAYVDRWAGGAGANRRRALVTTTSPDDAARLIDLIFLRGLSAEPEIAA